MGARLTLIFAAVAVLLAVFSADAAEPRILLAGDSWAEYMWNSGAMSTALAAAGLDYGVEGALTAVGGTTAEEWAHNARVSGQSHGLLDFAAYTLNRYATIDVIHLSLGGNDILWDGFKANLTDAQLDALVEPVANHIEEVVEFFLAQRRDIRVVICDYDYMNFTDTLARNSNARQIWEGWGKPTAEDLNRASVRLGQAKLAVARKLDRCEYVQNWGLMQYWYGYPPDVAPQTVPFPGTASDYEPYPGGMIALPSPMEAFAPFGFGKYDPLHLSDQGYVYLATNCIEQYYSDWLTAPLPHFATVPSPYKGETEVPTDVTLSWRAGVDATQHAVYFGVNSLEFQGNVSDANFNPGPLDPGTTYRWRVDEITPDGTAAGDIWTFKTAGAAPGCNAAGASDPRAFWPLFMPMLVLVAPVRTKQRSVSRELSL